MLDELDKNFFQNVNELNLISAGLFQLYANIAGKYMCNLLRR